MREPRRGRVGWRSVSRMGLALAMIGSVLAAWSSRAPDARSAAGHVDVGLYLGHTLGDDFFFYGFEDSVRLRVGPRRQVRARLPLAGACESSTYGDIDVPMLSPELLGRLDRGGSFRVRFAGETTVQEDAALMISRNRRLHGELTMLVTGQFERGEFRGAVTGGSFRTPDLECELKRSHWEAGPARGVASVTRKEVRYIADWGPSTVVASTTPRGALVITDSGVMTSAGKGCRARGLHTVVCQPRPRAVFDVGTGDDVVDALAVRVPLTIRGGDGDDSIVGGTGADRIAAGVGQDDVDGGAGADRLTGWRFSDSSNLPLGEGQDDLRGGPGDDQLSGDSSDVLDGGEGSDLLRGRAFGATYEAGTYGGEVTYESRNRPVRVSFDGLANDGERREADNVSGFETVRGGRRGDLIDLGAARKQPTESFGVLAFAIGGPGDDRLLSGAGGQGLYGEGGEDTLDGGPGRDVVAGGPGRDRLAGGPGRDDFPTRDRHPDVLADCGPADAAFIDPYDRRSDDCGLTDTDVGGVAGASQANIRHLGIVRRGGRRYVSIKVVSGASRVRVQIRLRNRRGRVLLNRRVRVRANRYRRLGLSVPRRAVNADGSILRS